MLNDLWNMIFQSHGMVNQPLVFFRKGGVEPDDIVFEQGNRIPVQTEVNRKLTDDIMISSGQGLPPDHYRLVDMVERNVDLVAGSFEGQRGESTGGADTATEVLTLDQNSQSRTELIIQNGEMVFLKDLGEKASSIVEQFASFQDYEELVGPEKAIMIYSANPADLPGGFNFAFKGSDRVQNMLVRQRNLKELVPIITQYPNAKIGGILNKLLQAYDYDKYEIDDMIWTDEEMAMIQQAQMQQAMAMGMLPAQQGQPTTGQPGGRFQSNTPGQVRQDQMNDINEVVQ